MKGAEALIPARFLTLLSHLDVLIGLIWESEKTVQRCLPMDYHEHLFQTYHRQLLAGYASAFFLIVVELMTFLSGLTLMSTNVAFVSVACHGSASVLLAHWLTQDWSCDCYWLIFGLCVVLPSFVDLVSAITNELQQLTQSSEYKGRWSVYLVLAAVVTTFGSSLPVGYNIGVVNTPAEVITQFCNESFISRYDLVLDKQWLNVLWSSVVSIFIVGGCTGSIMGAFFADRLGRKNATIFTSILWIVGALLFLFCEQANSVEMLILGRLIVGLSGGLTTAIVPMYLTELAPPALTGAMGVACPMGVNVGVLVGQVMGLNFLLGAPQDWPYLLSVYAVLVIVCLPLLCMLPESPKYLYVVKRDEDTAIRELSRLRGVSPSILTDDIDMLREELQAASARSDQAWSMWRVVSDPRLRLPLLLACSMQAGQQTSGINAVFYYSTMIFKQVGFSDAYAQYGTIGCGFINVCTALLMIKLLPLKGRRVLLLGSILSATVILAALAVAMLFMNAVSFMPYVCMVAVLSYVLVYGFGLGPIPYFIASELFEVGPRPAGMAWGSLANWGGNFLVGMCFPLMRQSIGAYSFLVFSGVTGALYVFQRLYFPETRGKTPAQVAELCSKGFKSTPTTTIQLNNV